MLSGTPCQKVIALPRITRALPQIALVAFAAVLPMCFLGVPSGHDFWFHAQSWIDVAQQWHQGIVYPRWAALPNHGAGDPWFVFYPPACRLAGALLLSVLPAQLVAGTYLFLVLIVAGVAMFALARQFLPPEHATIAACFYAVNPYMLLCVYQRSSFAEVLAGAFFPLVVAFALHLPERRAVLALAVSFAVCWLSDLPAAVVVTYALALMLVILAMRQRSSGTLLWGAAAMALGFLLITFFLLPAEYEQRWVDIQQNIAPDFRADTWEFTWDWDAEGGWFFAILAGIAYGEMALGTFAAFAAWFARRRHATAWTLLTILTAGSVFLMLPVARPLYTYVPKLQYIQFPWRWLFVLSTAMAALLGVAMARFRARWFFSVSLLIALAGGIAASWGAPWEPRLMPRVQRDNVEHAGFDGHGEFMPPSANWELFSKRTTQAQPAKIVGPDGGTVKVVRWTPVHKSVEVETSKPAMLELWLLAYPGWVAQIDGRAAAPDALTTNQAGQLLVPLPPGRHRLEVTFHNTPDRTAGTLLSILGIVFTAILGWRWRRAAQSSLQSDFDREKT